MFGCGQHVERKCSTEPAAQRRGARASTCWGWHRPQRRCGKVVIGTGSTSGSLAHSDGRGCGLRSPWV